MLDQKRIDSWIQETEFEGSRSNYPKNFPDLPDLPSKRYSDPLFFDAEVEGLWKKNWLYAGHLDQLPEQGSFFIWDKTGSEIIILRNDSGNIVAFYNTCRHRGSAIVRKKSGTLGKTFACGYHGWTYDRDGKLKAFPDVRDFSNFDRSCRNLVQVRCEIYGNWIFVNENNNAEPLADFLNPISRFFDHLPLKSLRLIHQHTQSVPCNYKVLIENFLEVYHFRLLHPSTTDRIFSQKKTAVHLWERGHSMMLSPHRRKGWVDPGTIGLPEMSTTTRIEREFLPSYTVFPNFVLPIQATGVGAVLVWPVDIANSLMDVVWFAPSWGDGPRPKIWSERINNFDKILEEDTSFAMPMQKSISTPGFKGVALNYQERRIYHWHEELDRSIGKSNVPEGMSVEPLMSQFIER